jgi:hypothetical protein
MCLTLSYVEAMLWKQKAHNLISSSAAAQIPPDPLLQKAPELSAIVSVVDGIKKRHGLLIEEALIAAINLVPNWCADRRAIPRKGGGVFRTDCVAINTAAKIAYVFECKRQYSSFDKDKKTAIDARLDEIATLFPAFAGTKGWSVTTTGVFILSFYGKGCGSKYPIHDRDSVTSLFPPCAMRFVNDFTDYTATIVGRWCSERLDSHALAVDETANPQQKMPSADANFFETLERETFAENDCFEVGIEGVRVIRSAQKL